MSSALFPKSSPGTAASSSSAAASSPSISSSVSGPARWVRLCVAAAVGLSMPLAAATALAPSAAAQSAREKCQEDTDQYNAAMEAAWRTANPGQEVPEPYPWPPYHCGGGIGIDIGGPGGGGGGDQSGPPAGSQQRPDRWGGESITSGGSGISQRGQDVGAPRTNVAPPPRSDGPGALESARSNVQVPIQPAQVVGDDGVQQEVLTAGGDQRWVVDEQGLTTGQRVITDDTGASRVVDDEVIAAGVPADEALEQAAQAAGESEQALSDSAVDDNDDVVSGGAQEPVDESVDTAAGAVAAVVDDAVIAATGAGALVAGAVGGLVRLPARAGSGGAPGSGGAARGSAPSSRGGSSAVGVPPTPTLPVAAEPPWRGQSAQFGWTQPDGDQQRFVLLADESSDRVHRFDMDVPAGGQMVVNPDGSVDVLDDQGTVVDHVRAPWAYDVTGRPVDTWYEVDSESGELVQVIDPDRSTRFPVLADPEQDAAEAASRNKSGNGGSTSGGRDFSQDQMVRNGTISADEARLDAEDPRRDPGFIGPVQEPERAGQQRNAQRAANSQQANIARGGSATPAPTPSSSSGSGSSSSSPSGSSSNSGGSGSGAASSQTFGSSTPSTPTSQPAAVHPSQQQSQMGPTDSGIVDQQSREAIQASRDGSEYPKDPSSNDPLRRSGEVSAEDSVRDAQDPRRQPGFVGPVEPAEREGQQRNRERERIEANNQSSDYANGPAVRTPERQAATDAMSPDSPEARLGSSDGPVVVNNPDDGTADVIQPNGSAMTVDGETGEALHLGTTRNPVQGPVSPGYYNPETNEYQDSPDSGWAEAAEGGDLARSIGTSAAGAVGGQMIESTAEGIQSGEVSTKPSNPTAASVGRAAGGAAFGVALGTASNIGDGMDPGTAVTTNVAGAAAGVAVGALTTAVAGPVAGFVVGSAVSYFVTEGLQDNFVN